MQRFLIAALAILPFAPAAHAGKSPGATVAAYARQKMKGLQIYAKNVSFFALNGPGRFFNASAKLKAPHGIQGTRFTVTGRGQQTASGFSITTLKITRNTIQPKGMAH